MTDLKDQDEQEEQVDQEEQLSGWADSVSKILKSNKPKHKKHIILSRAKKDYDQIPVQKNKRLNEDLLIVGENNEIKEENDDDDDDEDGEPKKKKKKSQKPFTTGKQEDETELLTLKQCRSLLQKQKLMDKELANLNRTKPNAVKDKEIERNLVKIATKGVVQLFNAIQVKKKERRNRNN